MPYSIRPGLNWKTNALQLSAADRNWHDLSASARSTTIFVTPATTIRAVSMRDTGTEMTPAASQEPSRAGNAPIRAN